MKECSEQYNYNHIGTGTFLRHKMEQSYFSKPLYPTIKIDNNVFEGKGCKYITNARMENLTVLDIGKIALMKVSIK